MSRSTIKTRNNASFDMAFHLVLVCKYRNQVFDDDMLNRCREIMRSTLLRWRCELLEFGGESDHVHLVFRAHPALNPSGLVNNLKTVSSRLLRKEFSERVANFYWKPVFWSSAYYLGTVGSNDLETVRKYVSSQNHQNLLT